MPKKKEYIPGQPSGATGPQIENFDAAYENDQIQKMAMESDRASLVDIDRQLALANKELARSKSRVSPAQGRTQANVVKSTQYEANLINTQRFLEVERETVVQILDEKKAMLPESYSSASENKNIVNKSIEGPPVINNIPKTEGPKFVPQFNTKIGIMESVTFATSPAPAQEAPNVKKNETPIGRITREPSTKKTVIADDGTKITYDSPGSIVYPEVKVGSTVSGKPITSTTPSRDLLTERMDKSDMDIFKEQQEIGAKYQEKINSEAINQEKLEFDFNKGEAKIVGNDSFDRVSTQEMFIRNSGRDKFETVDANEANKAADIKIAQQKNMTAEERRRTNAAEDKKRVLDAKADNVILGEQTANVYKTGDKRLTNTGLTDIPSANTKTFEVSSKGSDLGKEFSALNATFKTGPYAGKTIEEVWQKDIKQSGKNRKPGPNSILEQGNIAQSKTEYQKLWNEWAKQNPSKMKELESVVKRGYVLTDSFAGDTSKTVNQAEALTNLTSSVAPTNKTTSFKVNPPKSKIKDTPKSGGSFEISSAARAAAAAKVAKAMKNLGGKTNMLNIPIMTKGSADKIFKDFFGKQDYSS